MTLRRVAGGVRADLPVVGCAPGIAAALAAIDGSRQAETAMAQLELPTTMRGKRRGMCALRRTPGVRGRRRPAGDRQPPVG